MGSKISMKPWSFSLRFGMREEYGPLLIKILEDYMVTSCTKKTDLEEMDPDDLATAQWVSKIYFELRRSYEVGDAECNVNMFMLEKLPKIVLNYRDDKKGPHCLCSTLWMSLKNMAERANEWTWG